MVDVYEFGEVKVEIYEETQTVITELTNGERLVACPQSDDDYLKRAEELGYGDNAWGMCKDHEICHVFLAHTLGLTESPTIRGVVNHKESKGNYWPWWHIEEDAVLKFQKYANYAGANLEDALKPFKIG